MNDDKPVNMCAGLNKTFAQLKERGSLETGETEFAIEDPLD